MTFDTLSFPNRDSVTGSPTIDGWTGNLDAGVTAKFTDSGWANGGRISYEGGGDVPPAAIQCARMEVTAPTVLGPDATGVNQTVPPGEYLAIGFFCTNDYTFDPQDGVTI